MATLASLLLKLAVDRTAYTSGMRASKADADDFAAGVQKSMDSATKSANNAAAAITRAKAAAASSGTKGVVISAADRQAFMNPAFQAAEAQHQAALAANQMAKETEKATTAQKGLNKELSHTSFLIASFVALGFIHFLTGAVEGAAKFESQMLQLHTQARATVGEVNRMTEAVLEIAPAVRTGPEALAEALYHIESVGYRGARALDILETAAQGARVGNANLTSVTNALVAALATGIEGLEDLSAAMGTIDAVVGTGNMTMEEFTKSLRSGLLSTAKQFGISFQDIGAAIATMTDQGIPATESATRLRIAIALLAAPTQIAQTQLSRIGLTSTRLAEEMSGPQGLIGALTVLRDHLHQSGLSVEQQSQLLVRAFGGGRTSSGILTLINSLDLMNQKLGVINETSEKFPELVAAQAETAQAHFQELQAVVEVLAIQLGNTLLPIIVAVAQAFAVLAQHTEIMIPLLLFLTALLGVRVAMALGSFVTGTLAATQAMLVQTGVTNVLTGSLGRLAIVQSSVSVGAMGMSASMSAAIPVLGMVAAAAVAVGIAFMNINAGLDKQTQEINENATKWANDAETTIQELQAARDGIQKELDRGRRAKFTEGGFTIGGWDVFNTEQKIQSTIDVLEQAIEQKRMMGSIKPEEILNPDELVDATETLVERFGTSIDGVRAAAADAGANAMLDMAKEIRAQQQAPVDAFGELRGMLENALDPMKEVARLMAIMTSAELAAGLASNDAAVVAQAEALKKLVTDRLDEITLGAYSAGQQATNQLAEGLVDPTAVAKVASAIQVVGAPIAAMLDKITGGSVFSAAVKGLTDNLTKMSNQPALRGEWETKWAPGAEAVAQGMNDINKELAETQSRSAALSDLNQAFNQIGQAAHRFFDRMHRDNLRAIDDALKHKNAILDAKKALNQAPVTAAQNALDFQRRQIEEWRLRQAVAEARGPEEQRDAILALQDFLAQVHIDDMQAQVDAANSKIDTQKEANERMAEEQRAAENRRYELQVESFDRQLELLRRYLEKHPGEWQNTEEKIIALLNSYGLTYKTAGESLSSFYVEGLRESITAAQEAAKKLAEPIVAAAGQARAAIGQLVDDWGAYRNQFFPSTSTGSNTGWQGGGGMIGPGGGWSWMGPTHHSGLAQSPNDHLALIRRDESVLTPQMMDLIRQFSTAGRTTAVAPRAMSTGSSGGGDTVVIQIGDEVVGEVVDKSLYRQGRRYTPKRAVRRRGTLR